MTMTMTMTVIYSSLASLVMVALFKDISIVASVENTIVILCKAMFLYSKNSKPTGSVERYSCKNSPLRLEIEESEKLDKNIVYQQRKRNYCFLYTFSLNFGLIVVLPSNLY